MTTLHIFNPEHDLALAFGGKYFTPPHAARELRTDMGFLPAVWAQDGDIVLVDDVEFAVKAARRFAGRCADVLYLSLEDLKRQAASSGFPTMTISPWGWDAALCQRLLAAGIPEGGLPTWERLAELRRLSGRGASVSLLAELRHQIASRELVGERYCATDEESLDRTMAALGTCVLKAPWSSSGRGVRYVSVGERQDVSVRGWASRILAQQGMIVVEPYYRKIRDFAMEFQIDESGRVEYLGLSLFHTQHATYTGNLLATEKDKRKILCEQVREALLDKVSSGIAAWVERNMGGVYTGPFGVDMMIVSGGADVGADASKRRKSGSGNGGYKLHPCVEINLRRTMGHVALALSPSPLEPQRVMQIVHDVNYQLRIVLAANCFVNVV